MPSQPGLVQLTEAACEAGRAAGLDAVGVALAEPFASTRRDLEDRRQRGLHAGMRFTYRQPARSSDPTTALPDARSIVVGARSYLRADPAGDAPDTPQARVARYAWDDHYVPLKAALRAVARVLKGAGFRARVLADDNALVDREAAYRAALGWYGKNANVLLPGQGSWFVLGSVVTDAPLVATDTRAPDGCGACTRCISGCPTGAIVEPGVVDARRCLAWLLQVEGVFPRDYRAALGDRIYGCDDCQEVCPPNRKARAPDPASAADATGHDPAAGSRVDVLDLLAASDAELLERYGRWYVPRREPRYLRRNALVVLGNTGNPRDERVVAALVHALGDRDAIVRSHAVWAARHLGRADLLSGLAHDDDPMVRAELEADEP